MAEHVDLETIKSLREEINWEDERERRDFLRRLQPLIENWNDQLPNLWSFFRPEEIKRLIADSAKGIILATYYVRVEEFQRFKAFVFAGCNEGNYLEFDEPLRRFVRAYHLYRGFGVPDWLIFEIYAKFDANYFDEKTRLKNFHLACKYASYDVVKKFLELGLDANYLQREGGYSALHLSASCIHDDVARTIELLLRNGANPNVADWMGTTPLHMLCVHANHDNVDAVERFLVVCDDVRQRVHIDARDRDGRTPLHLASEFDRKGVIELLLRRGADPNAEDAQGTTPLHHIAKLSQSYEDDMAEIFFEVCAEMQRTVRVNAQDNLGNTPLHLIMPWGDNKAFKTLLRRGADPNLANEDERTPLHVICEYDRGDEFAQILFEICDEMQLTVQVNARDKSGKTPLQLAVANLLPNAVDGLFNRGADITNCIFPTSIDTKLQIDSPLNYKMRVASGALAVAEHLEARGYNFSRRDALTIVNYFVKHGLFETSSSDLEKSLRNDHEFASKAKKAMIVPSLSLYDLIHLRPEEEEKLLTYMDYFVFAARGIQLYIHPSHYENCYLHLCEKLSRGFFRRWALDPFYELIHKRLSIECCEMVLETLENQDLCNICLAAAGQAS